MKISVATNYYITQVKVDSEDITQEVEFVIGEEKDEKLSQQLLEKLQYVDENNCTCMFLIFITEHRNFWILRNFYLKLRRGITDWT